MGYVEEVLADSPRAFYRMNESSGLPQDSSGNGLHMTTTTGTPIYGLPGPIADGNTAIQLPSAGYFSRADNALLDLGDVFSLEGWFQRTETGASDKAILGKGSCAYLLRLSTSHLAEMLRSQVQGLVTSGDHPTITNTTAWYHAVGTKNGASFFLYLNGADMSASEVNSVCVDNALDFMLGADHLGTTAGQLILANLAVYPTALSATRIKAHYDARFVQRFDNAQFPEPKLRPAVPVRY